MTNKIEMPEPLSIYVLHSPEERRRHAIEVQAYNDYLREEEKRQETIEKAKAAEANRVMTDDEYWALAKEREAAKQAKQAERDAEEKAKADEKKAYLASQPEVAVVSETNPYTFLLQVTHWAQQGYSLSETADITVLPSFYSASFNKPAPSKKAAK